MSFWDDIGDFFKKHASKGVYVGIAMVFAAPFVAPAAGLVLFFGGGAVALGSNALAVKHRDEISAQQLHLIKQLQVVSFEVDKVNDRLRGSAQSLVAMTAQYQAELSQSRELRRQMQEQAREIERLALGNDAARADLAEARMIIAERDRTIAVKEAELARLQVSAAAARHRGTFAVAGTVSPPGDSPASVVARRRPAA